MSVATPKLGFLRTLWLRIFGKTAPAPPARRSIYEEIAAAHAMPELTEQTGWPRLHNAFRKRDTDYTFFSHSALQYLSAIACFFEGGDGLTRPACTLAHVAATVSLVGHDAVLTALSTDESAAHLVAPLLAARQAGAHGQIAGIIPHAHALVAEAYGQTDQATRQRVLAYFESLA